MSNGNIVRGNSQQPPMPIPQRPERPTERPADPRALFPAAIAIQELYDENARLKKQCDELTNELIVARESLQQADRSIEFERTRVVEADRWKEVYQRYAVEIHKGLRDGLTLIEKAMSMAMELARKGESEVKQIDKTVEELRKQAVEDALNMDNVDQHQGSQA